MKSLINILSNKCPNCKKGHVFKTSIFNPFSIGKMDQNCSHCGFTYEKEPGFFFGAMYVSYALIVAESVTAFVILRLLLNLNWFVSFGGIVVLSLFLFAVNFKLSRVIWIYIFHSEKDKKNS